MSSSLAASSRSKGAAMNKLAALCVCLTLLALSARGSHHHHRDTTGSTDSTSSTTGSTDSTSSTTGSSDSHHHSDHHPHGSSYSSHDHDDHHRHGGAANRVRREARWTGSDERVLLRKMRVQLDAAKLRSSSASDVSKPVVVVR